MSLYESLLQLLIKTPLWWMGNNEGDYGVQAVRLTAQELEQGNWTVYEADAFPSFVQVVNRDCDQQECPCSVAHPGKEFSTPYRACPRNCVKKAWNEMEEILDNGEEMVSYTRPNNEENAVDLLTVVEEKGVLVGIQTAFVNT